MKSKEKKRSLNELRQTKEYYKSPLSHTKSKNQKIKFTKKELLSFSYGMFVNIMGLIGWLGVSIMWNDRALIIINAVGVSIYANGIVAYIMKGAEYGS